MRARVAGLVLAGGRSTRFGSDKAEAELDGRPLTAIVRDRLAEVCEAVAVSAAPGSAGERVAEAIGAPVLHDDPAHPAGPLAGIVQGLRWAARLGADRLAVLPCDTPFVPAAAVLRLSEALGPGIGAAAARTPDGAHALCCVLRVETGARLAARLAAGEHPSVRDAFAPLGLRWIDFEDPAVFANLNTPQDLTAR